MPIKYCTHVVRNSSIDEADPVDNGVIMDDVKAKNKTIEATTNLRSLNVM